MYSQVLCQQTKSMHHETPNCKRASQTVSHSTASAPSACHTACASPMQAACLTDRVRCVCAGIQRAGASDAVGLAGVNIDLTVAQSDACAYVRDTESAAARMSCEATSLERCVMRSLRTTTIKQSNSRVSTRKVQLHLVVAC